MGKKTYKFGDVIELKDPEVCELEDEVYYLRKQYNEKFELLWAKIDELYPDTRGFHRYINHFEKKMALTGMRDEDRQ